VGGRSGAVTALGGRQGAHSYLLSGRGLCCVARRACAAWPAGSAIGRRCGCALSARPCVLCGWSSSRISSCGGWTCVLPCPEFPGYADLHPQLQRAPGLLSLALEPEGTYPRSPPHAHDSGCRWGCVGVPFELLLVFLRRRPGRWASAIRARCLGGRCGDFGFVSIVFAVGRHHPLQRACPCAVVGARRHFFPVGYQFSWSTTWGTPRSARRPHLGHWW